MSPLEGTTLELRTTSKGRWMYHCHILDHVEEGMLGYFDVN
jgi:FtsP/CotA-like multicopper oxidase with cupredoxin domain